ncbi:hypothetical protein BG07_5276 [Bacillus pseudomycoides]|nr:hypothetical protein DJ92_5032 [Bacillus pseudomycoides]AJI18977.1 hypothetical protein BG07_5276 [Bacillus pseudomycoides]
MFAEDIEVYLNNNGHIYSYSGKVTKRQIFYINVLSK